MFHINKFPQRWQHFKNGTRQSTGTLSSSGVSQNAVLSPFVSKTHFSDLSANSPVCVLNWAHEGAKFTFISSQLYLRPWNTDISVHITLHNNTIKITTPLNTLSVPLPWACSSLRPTTCRWSKINWWTEFAICGTLASFSQVISDGPQVRRLLLANCKFIPPDNKVSRDTRWPDSDKQFCSTICSRNYQLLFPCDFLGTVYVRL